jgi:hypothetical protein
MEAKFVGGECQDRVQGSFMASIIIFEHLKGGVRYGNHHVRHHH